MRRRRALLAALLLLAVLIGLELFRRVRLQPAAPVSIAAPEFLGLPPPDARPFSAPPAAPPRFVGLAGEREVDEVTVEQFLGILAKRRRTPATERFLDAFAARPALRRTLWDLSKAGGDKAPAGQLVRVMSELPEFQLLLSEFRDDPGFREAVADAAQDPRVGRALGGFATISPSGEIDLASMPAAASEGASTGPPDAAGAAGPGAHEVRTRLAGIRREVGERAARATIPSLFASMPREERERLEVICDRHGFCDPVSACRVSELWGSCVAVCRGSGKCPPELLEEEEPDVPVVVPDGF